jgi:hypothetical protein
MIEAKRNEIGRFNGRVASDICPSGHDKSVTGSYKNGACRECRRERNRSDRHKAKSKGLRRGRRYGVSPEQFVAMLSEQRGVCAICQQPETLIRHGEVQQLSIDHNHETGEVRGLLCNNCNRATGLFQDDPNILIKAAAYLRGWQPSSQ